MDSRPGAVLWVVKQYELSQADAESIVDAVWDNVRARYGDELDETEFTKVFNKAVRNGVYSFLRAAKKKLEFKLPPPGNPVDRFKEFVLGLGCQSRRELVHWHKGMTPEESASFRGIAVESVKRERRRIVERWKRYLQGCTDLTEAEKRELSPYLYGSPKLGDIQ